MYGAKDDGFYITLPSNASLNVFKDNKSSSYRVDLAQHIDLEGEWQVALSEISYPHTWFNIPNENAYFEWRKKPLEGESESEVHQQRFRGGYYNNQDQLKIELNGFLRKIGSDITLQYSYIQKRYEYSAGGKYHLRFYPPAAYMLGFEPGTWIEFTEKMAPYPSDMRGGLYHLFLYTDLVSYQMVGDAYAPLLRTLEIKGSYGDIITQQFNPCHYLPVTKQHIENIKIEIKSDQNIPLKFTFGKTIVKLHFRPKV